MSQIVPDGKEKIKKAEKDEDDEQKSLQADGNEKEEKKEEKKTPVIMSREQTLFFDAVKKRTLNKQLLIALLAKNITIDGEDADDGTASSHCIWLNDLTML